MKRSATAALLLDRSGTEVTAWRDGCGRGQDSFQRRGRKSRAPWHWQGGSNAWVSQEVKLARQPEAWCQRDTCSVSKSKTSEQSFTNWKASRNPTLLRYSLLTVGSVVYTRICVHTCIHMHPHICIYECTYFFHFAHRQTSCILLQLTFFTFIPLSNDTSNC